MDFETLKTRIPDTAKDIRLNLGSLDRSEHLTPGQLWGTVLAVALATRQADVIRAAMGETRKRLAASPADASAAETTIAAARTAAALMAMNNIFYRSRHLLHDDTLNQVLARLRMQGMMTHGAPQVDFELWSVGVSAVNGCGMCLESHVGKLKEHGVRMEAVNDVLRIAAVLFAAASVIDGETALAGV
ncbi:MAG: carboxymuconolactone decarboxylase family protein [Planctomycetes bacterium]|nr:carboxymuconolactone decarboxylase family protein [Planctomycetota bacterium]